MPAGIERGANPALVRFHHVVGNGPSAAVDHKYRQSELAIIVGSRSRIRGGVHADWFTFRCAAKRDYTRLKLLSSSRLPVALLFLLREQVARPRLLVGEDDAVD